MEKFTERQGEEGRGDSHEDLKIVLLKRLCMVLIAVYFLSWCLASTARSTIYNIPTALIILWCTRWIFMHYEIQPRRPGLKGGRPPEPNKAEGDDPADSSNRESAAWRTLEAVDATFIPGPAPGAEQWRQHVGSPIVSDAWDRLCGSVIQEFVYDLWYAYLTEDREFPAEVRASLNRSFGELALRAKRVDLRALLIRDSCRVLRDLIGLYRQTCQSIGLERRVRHAASWGARERALRAAMRQNGTLHPAVENDVALKRYLRRISEGVCCVLMDPRDIQRPIPRTLIRELVTACVMRPSIGMFTPNYINNLLLGLLPMAENEDAVVGGDNPSQAAQGQGATYQAAIGQRASRSALLEQEQLALRAAAAASKQQKPMGSAPDLAALAIAAAAGLATGGPGQRDSGGLSPSVTREASAVTKTPGGTPSGGGNPNGPAPPPLSLSQAPAATSNGASSGAAQSSAPQTGSGSGGAGGASNSGASTPSRRGPERVSGAPHKRVKGFDGPASAHVVAAEMVSEGKASFVAYTIRVSDASGEWTVLRRFRNYELFHRRMRHVPGYVATLPPKRLLFHNKSVEFVEERRIRLHHFLQSVLGNPSVSDSWEVYEFLRPNSVLYNIYEESEKSILGRARRSPSPAPPPKIVAKVQGGAAVNGGGNSGPGPVGSVSGGPRPVVQQGVEPKGPLASSAAGRGAATSSRNLPTGSSGASSSTVTFSVPHAASEGPVPHGLHGRSRSASLESRIPAGDSGAGSMQGREPSYPRMVDEEDSTRSASNWNGSVGPSEGDISTMDRLDMVAPEGWEEGSSVTEPLDGLIDEIFQLKSRDWFRRQVVAVARNVLSLLAGDSLDRFLEGRLKTLRQEHTIARLMLMLHSALWPSGVWFQSFTGGGGGAGSAGCGRPSQGAAGLRVPPSPEGARPMDFLGTSASQRSQQNGNGAGPAPSSSRSTPKPPPQHSHRPSTDGLPGFESWCPALDGSEMREQRSRVLARIMGPGAHRSLVSLLGKKAYEEGLMDVFCLIQSPTFVSMLTLGLNEVVTTTLFPELKYLVQEARETKY